MRSRVLASALVVTAALAAGCGANSSSPAAPTAPPAPSAAAPTPAHGGRQGIQGTVTAEDGSTWTVTTDRRGPFTVTVTPQTAFGTKKAPGTAQQFPVGTRVRVAGAISGSTITANRIVQAAAGGKRDRGASVAPTTPAAVTPAAPAT
jgi:Domain of unknown function (DUF5666)